MENSFIIEHAKVHSFIFEMVMNQDHDDLFVVAGRIRQNKTKHTTKQDSKHISQQYSTAAKAAAQSGREKRDT